MPEERLDIAANVEDRFSDALGKLQKQLVSTDQVIRKTGGGGNDEIRVDVEVETADAIAELEALDKQIDRVDDDIDIGVNEGVGTGTGINATDDNEGIFSDFNRVEAATAADFLGPFQFQDDTGRGAPGIDSGEGVATEGGEDDASLFSARDIDKLDSLFGEYLDEQKLANMGGEAQDPDDILEVPMNRLLDGDKLIEAVRDPDSDVDFQMNRDVRGRAGLDSMMEAVEELDDMDGSFTRLNERPIVRKLRNTSRRFDQLRLSIRGLHVAFAALLPLVITLAGALPVVITGMVALGTAALGAAGALGAIAGLGLMGASLQEEGELSLSAVQNELSGITDAFVEAFAPLAQTFVPVMREGITQIENMMGPLANAASILLTMRDNFRGAISYLTNAIPSFTRELLAFTNAMMPVLQRVANWFATTDFFGGLATQFARALPHLVAMFNSLEGIFQAVMNLSQGFTLVARIVLGMANTLLLPIRRFDTFGIVVGSLVGAFFAASAAAGIFRILVTGATASAARFAAVMAGSVIKSVYGYASAVVIATAQTWGWAAALGVVAGLLVIVTGGLALAGAAVSSLASDFNLLGSNIASARSELDKFAKTEPSMRGAGGAGGGMGTNGANVYRDNSTTVINASNPDEAARQQYSQQFERRQQIDSVFGG